MLLQAGCVCISASSRHQTRPCDSHAGMQDAQQQCSSSQTTGSGRIGKQATAAEHGRRQQRQQRQRQQRQQRQNRQAGKQASSPRKAAASEGGGIVGVPLAVRGSGAGSAASSRLSMSRMKASTCAAEPPTLSTGLVRRHRHADMPAKHLAAHVCPAVPEVTPVPWKRERQQQDDDVVTVAE